MLGQTAVASAVSLDSQDELMFARDFAWAIKSRAVASETLEPRIDFNSSGFINAKQAQLTTPTAARRRE
jgi:hypothetical protein